MDKQQITIRDANVNDAHILGWGLCEAIGKHIVEELAVHTSAQQVEEFFTQLARRDDTQYSWQNSLIALVDGEVAGVAVGYDGAKLVQLREQFFVYAEKLLKLKFEDVPSETEDGEYYLDTLAVKPEYRNKGVAQQLINAMFIKAKKVGKPLGLLVDDENPNAQSLYKKCGFEYIGRRPFAGTEMSHLQKNN